LLLVVGAGVVLRLEHLLEMAAEAAELVAC
jgi:hypothetical protein